MKYNPEKHHRRSIRLKGYDYSQSGVYFVTLCTQHRECLFGEIVNGEMHLNECGKIAERGWLEIPQHYPHASLDEFVIMPNHVHGIIVLNDDNAVGAKNLSPFGAKNLSPFGAKNFSPLHSPQQTQSKNYPCGTSKTIGSIVRGFKIGVTKWFRQHTDIYTVWQRNYYEHIIRNETELQRVREYIVNNPIQWK